MPRVIVTLQIAYDANKYDHPAEWDWNMYNGDGVIYRVIDVEDYHSNDDEGTNHDCE